MDATANLSESLVLRKQGLWTIYLGTLGGTAVVIKILDSTSEYGEKMFFQEVAVLYGMRHPNVVKLVGACLEVHAVVYEYLPYGDLRDLLEYSPELLTWERRTRIIYEICSVLIYLHSRGVVHADVEPCNIFLDINLKSKLCNFGFSSFLPEEMTMEVFLETTPRGTAEYIDPFFLETGILRSGSNLYSFGIMILTLLTDMQPVGLNRLISDTDEESFHQMIAPTARNWPIEQAMELAYWSLQCCYHDEKNSSELLMDMSTCLEEMLAEIETLQVGSFQRRQRTGNEPRGADHLSLMRTLSHNKPVNMNSEGLSHLQKPARIGKQSL